MTISSLTGMHVGCGRVPGPRRISAASCDQVAVATYAGGEEISVTFIAVGR